MWHQKCCKIRQTKDCECVLNTRCQSPHVFDYSISLAGFPDELAVYWFMWLIHWRPEVNTYIACAIQTVHWELWRSPDSYCLHSIGKWTSFLCWTTRLGRASVARHVFDPDGVCHVGEMIPAPADVLKGTAGRGQNHSAKAKARPATNNRRHAVQTWQWRCIFI